MPLPHNLFSLVGMQGDTETGTAVAGTLDETISKYEQEKRGVSATCTSPWVFVNHNTSNAPRPVHFVFQARRRNIGWGLCSGPLSTVTGYRRFEAEAA